MFSFYCFCVFFCLQQAWNPYDVHCFFCLTANTKAVWYAWCDRTIIPRPSQYDGSNKRVTLKVNTNNHKICVVTSRARFMGPIWSQLGVNMTPVGHTMAHDSCNFFYLFKFSVHFLCAVNSLILSRISFEVMEWLKTIILNTRVFSCFQSVHHCDDVGVILTREHGGVFVVQSSTVITRSKLSRWYTQRYDDSNRT